MLCCLKPFFKKHARRRPSAGPQENVEVAAMPAAVPAEQSDDSDIERFGTNASLRARYNALQTRKGKQRQVQEIFPLLKLPLEIQRMIYRHIFQLESYVFAVEKPGHTPTWSPREHYSIFAASTSSVESYATFAASISARGPGGIPMTFSPAGASLSVLRVLTLNHHIYNECLPLFYTLNTLSFNTTMQLFLFLKAIPTHRRRHIHSLLIHNLFAPVDEQVARQAYSLLNLLPSLAQLQFVIWPNLSISRSSGAYIDIVLHSLMSISVPRFKELEEHWIAGYDFDAWSGFRFLPCGGATLQAWMDTGPSFLYDNVEELQQMARPLVVLASLRGLEVFKVWGDAGKWMAESPVATGSGWKGLLREEETWSYSVEVDAGWVREIRYWVTKEKKRGRGVVGQVGDTGTLSRRGDGMVMGSGSGSGKMEYLEKVYPEYVEHQAKLFGGCRSKGKHASSADSDRGYQGDDERS